MHQYLKSTFLIIAVCLVCTELSKAQVVGDPVRTNPVVNGNVADPNGTQPVIGSAAIVIAPSGNLLHKSSKNQTSKFSQWFTKIFGKKDKAQVKYAKESKKRARGKVIMKRHSNPR
ncbi:hypothetical protein [Pedobacter nyackensis]|uniref:hypothetical protein n=1 Tax=Pedobacter nyackensis TaxID=475255 RepID=UPI00292FADA9|nr:hypothetical protein [Pedobacter nyackensis]